MFILASCSSGSKSKPAEPELDLNQALETVSCANADDFRGIGIGGNENEAIAQARSNMAQEYFVEKLKSSVDIGGQNINGVASTSTHTSIIQNAKLVNPSDAKIYYSKKQGEQTGVVVCLTKADAAKGFVERERQVADSLEIVSAAMLSTEHPKHKNEAWQKMQMLYSDFVRIQNLLEGWGVKSPYSANEIYAKTKENYKDFCGVAKLHWNTEKETPYSEIAFSKLSGSIKIEKSPCADRGILLAYKAAEPECLVKFGLNTCSYANSLYLDACNGTEYLQLKGDAEGAHQRSDFALEKLQNNLKSAEFWNQWIQEIKQWSPQCE